MILLGALGFLRDRVNRESPMLPSSTRKLGLRTTPPLLNVLLRLGSKSVQEKCIPGVPHRRKTLIVQGYVARKQYSTQRFKTFSNGNSVTVRSTYHIRCDNRWA